ncbi:MAG: CoA transferase [Dehalococcoidia bacterium]|nr:CoA transferase [Dehalococcoidia bacterium]
MTPGWTALRKRRSPYIASPNRNKGSLALDLKSDPGREVFLRLAQQAHVVVENFRRSPAELDCERLRDLNPRLVYTACARFGRSGPANTQRQLM